MKQVTGTRRKVGKPTRNISSLVKSIGIPFLLTAATIYTLFQSDAKTFIRSLFRSSKKNHHKISESLSTSIAFKPFKSKETLVDPFNLVSSKETVDVNPIEPGKVLVTSPAIEDKKQVTADSKSQTVKSFSPKPSSLNSITDNLAEKTPNSRSATAPYVSLKKNIMIQILT